METRTEIYALAELEGGYFYIVEKKDLKHLDDLKTELEYSDCLYRIGDSGEVGIAEYSEEIMWYPQIKERYIRDLTESDRKAIREAIKETERKYTEEMEQHEIDYQSDKNNQLQHLKKAMVELIDNTLGSDMEWRLDNFEEVKRKVEEIKDTTEMICFFDEIYDYVYSLEDSEEWVEEFQEFGHDELDVRFCEKCGSMFCAGYYFPNFMYEREGVCEYMCEDCFESLPTEVKEAWDEFYSDDGEDCYSEWGI